MFEVAVYSAIATQTHDVNATAALLGMFERLHEIFIDKKASVTNSTRDAHYFLFDDSTRSDVLMADFAVTHDTFGQTDIVAAGFDLHVRILRHQSFIDGRISQMHSVGVVPFGIGIRTPAVTND